MGYEHLEVRTEGLVDWVTMNRPDQLNALNRKLIDELRGYFLQVYDRRDVRVVILQGAGRAFCAGLDLKEHAGRKHRRTPAEVLDSQRGIRDIVIAMRRCPQPIISIVNGAASGGGFALALASDVRLATPQGRMNAAFVRIGLSACDIGVSYFLPRMVGSSVAAEYMLTGRFIDPQRACALGLVSRVGDLEELRAEARALADDMLHASPLGLRLTKDALGHAIDVSSLEAAIALEDRNQALCTQDDDFREGVAAFLEKRRPKYAGS